MFNAPGPYIFFFYSKKRVIRCMKDQVLKFIENIKAWVIANPKAALLIAVFIFGLIIGGILF